MKVKSLVEFSGVPKGTSGECVEDTDDTWIDKDKKMWKVTWDLSNRTKPLRDWFDEQEFKKYLEVLS